MEYTRLGTGTERLKAWTSRIICDASRSQLVYLGGDDLATSNRHIRDFIRAAVAAA